MFKWFILTRIDSSRRGIRKSFKPKSNKILVDQNERQKIILKKFNSVSKSKNYKEQYNQRLLEEVVNIVEDPNVLLVNFDKEYLKIPQEIIISTLEKHQRYFPVFDSREKLTNYFFVVAGGLDFHIRWCVRFKNR